MGSKTRCNDEAAKILKLPDSEGVKTCGVDIFTELSKHHIYIFDPVAPDQEVDFVKGIVLSIPAMKNEQQIIQVTQKINNILRKMII